MQQLPQVLLLANSCDAWCHVVWRMMAAGGDLPLPLHHRTLPLQASVHRLASVAGHCRISTSAAATRLYPQQQYDAQYA
jgi:hypothetical protein